MCEQSQAHVGPRGSARVLVVAGIGVVVVLAGLGFAAWLLLAPQDTAGLEGTWRAAESPKHTYEFLPSGDVEVWYGRKGSLLFPMARFATWRRDGSQITVHTTRGWDFVGRLEGGAIRGEMLIRNEAGVIESRVAAAWLRE
ncbi:MAG: hypothetical protein U0793_03560 [Gemmataceae bacterium]